MVAVSETAAAALSAEAVHARECAGGRAGAATRCFRAFCCAASIASSDSEVSPSRLALEPLGDSGPCLDPPGDSGPCARHAPVASYT